MLANPSGASLWVGSQLFSKKYYFGVEVSAQGSYLNHTIFIVAFDGPNKLECYIALGWKILPGTDTLAHWVNS
jgi:hypothetical protein